MLLKNKIDYQTCLENYLSKNQNLTMYRLIVTLIMKTITLTATEFYLFKELAQKFHIMFTCSIASGFVFVEADAKILDYLGY